MHVAVTGASAGIGEALARRFAREGASLTLVARRRGRLEMLAAAVGVPCHVVEQDLSDIETADSWIEGAEAALGPIDILVNNAGVQVLGRSAEVDPSLGECSIRVNLFAPLRLIRRVLPGMLARGEGVVVNVASMAALAPVAGMTWYNASKAGLAAASESLRGELLGTGVHVVTVYPGIIPTTAMGAKGMAAYQSNRALALQPTGTPERLAELVHRAVVRRRARVIYPRANVLARWLPAPTRWMLDAFTPPLKD